MNDDGHNGWILMNIWWIMFSFWGWISSQNYWWKKSQIQVKTLPLNQTTSMLVSFRLRRNDCSGPQPVILKVSKYRFKHTTSTSYPPWKRKIPEGFTRIISNILEKAFVNLELYSWPSQPTEIPFLWVKMGQDGSPIFCRFAGLWPCQDALVFQ